MRLEPREPVRLEAGGDLQPLLQIQPLLVAVVEAAVEGREEPDPGGEPEIELEVAQMGDHLLGRSADGLGSQIGEGHGLSFRGRPLATTVPLVIS